MARGRGRRGARRAGLARAAGRRGGGGQDAPGRGGAGGRAGVARRGAVARAAAYGPVVAALRSRLRRDPAALDGVRAAAGAPGRAVAGARAAPAEASDRATVFEAVRRALETLAPARGAARRPAVVRRGDARAAGRARGAAAGAADARRGARTGPTRSAAGIRCGGCARICAAARLLRELIVAPLDAAASAALAERELGARAVAARWPTRCTTARRACRSSSRSSPPRCRRAIACGPGPDGLELAHDADVPVPETIRDAVLLRTAGLSPRAARPPRPPRSPARSSRSTSRRASTS